LVPDDDSLPDSVSEEEYGLNSITEDTERIFETFMRYMERGNMG
jgi:hypothetical protein